MQKKLTKTGNSFALVLDRSILERAKIDTNAPVEVLTDGECIVIAPVREKARAEQFRKVMEQINTQYAGVFRRLAK
jgi:antitoxin MazE